MAVIARVAGRDLARPIERQTHRLELRPHRSDIGVGPFGGMGGVLHRRVLGRHAERVPAHRVQHVEAPRALVARHHVAHRVVADMAHMDAPGRVREHLEHVIFWPRIVVAGGEDGRVGPCLLPFLFGFADVVAFRPHDVTRAVSIAFEEAARQNMIWPRGSNSCRGCAAAAPTRRRGALPARPSSFFVFRSRVVRKNSDSLLLGPPPSAARRSVAAQRRHGGSPGRPNRQIRRFSSAAGRFDRPEGLRHGRLTRSAGRQGEAP